MLTTIYRTAILYFFLILIMRLMGKRQIGQLQPGELVITILISEIAALPMQDNNIPMLQAIVPVCVLAVLEIIISRIALSSIKFRSLLQGHSIIVINNGKVDKKQMKRIRYSMDDLLEALRQKDIFDISDVQYAIVETDGTLSVLSKPEKRTATVEDVKAEPDNKSLPRVLISDGRLKSDQIEKTNMTMQEIEQLLKKKNIDRKQVLLLTADENGNINIIKE